MVSLRTSPSRIPRSVRTLDGRVKIALLMAFSVALFWAHSLSALAVAAALLAVVMALGRVRWVAVLKGGAPAYVIAAFLLVYNGVSLGWMAGAVVAARVLLLVWGSLVLVSLATATELSEALRRLLTPLGRVGLPVRDVTTALSVALRFIPLTAEELVGVRAAQASRGASFQGGGLRGRLAAYGGLMVPLFVGLFRRADRLAAAMDARCFGASTAPTTLDGRRFRGSDGAVLLVGIALCVAVALVP